MPRRGPFTRAAAGALVRVGAGALCAGLAVGAAPAVDAASSRPAAPPGKRTELALTQYVNPFIGTAVAPTSGYAGNVNPGAKAPFGMVNFGPDMPRTNFNGSGGYLTGANATSGRFNFFSLTHLNGVGCPGQGTVGMMPASTPTSVTNSTGTPLGVSFKTATESAAPGYYKVGLDNNVGVELTSTTRTGMARFAYPSKDAGYLSLDTRLNANANLGANRVTADNTSLTISEDGRVLSGKTVAPAFCTPYGTLWNSPVHFWAEVDKPLRPQAAGSTVNTVVNGSTVLQYDLPSDDPTLNVRVGISSVSVDNARLNLHTENADSTFDEVRTATAAQWNTRLNAIQVDQAATPQALTADERDRLVKFYTALYRVLGSPTVYSDVNGDFRSMKAEQPYPAEVDRTGGVAPRDVANVKDYTWTRSDGSTGSYSTHYSGLSMWDTYRSQAQLLALLAPDVASEVNQSLVVDGLQCGAFPHWVDASDDSTPMAGDSALSVVAGSYDFGAEDFDLVSAATLTKQSAFDSTSRCNTNASFSGMEDYLKTGYYPVERTHVSTNIERYNSDHAAAAFLDSLPAEVRAHESVAVTDADIESLQQRASWWRTIFDDTNKRLSGRTTPSTPGTPGAFATGTFHESTEPNYFWSFGFAWGELIDRLGGNEQAQARLNALFAIDPELTATPTMSQLNGGQESETFYMGNEMGFPAPWAYNWAGKPAATQYVVQKLIDTTFTTGRAGLPGNDDMGATSSWLVFANLGLFPTVAAEGGVSISTPQFPAATVWMGNTPLRITTDKKAAGAPFIQSMRLGTTSYPSSWLPLRKIRPGAELTFSLGSNPSSWAAAKELAPPSGADVNYTRMTATGDVK